MKRRTFLKSSTAAGLGYAAWPFIQVPRRQARYRTALIGSGWWGMNILRSAIAHGQSDVVALCDVDQNHLTEAQTEVEQLTGTQPNIYPDYRELLADANADLVIVATPDHWHALTAIAAIESGAHVYLEKPISHTVLEGKAILQTARDQERVVQVGTHRRVSPHNVSGMEFLKSGQVGDIGMVTAFVHSAGGPGEPTPDAEPPEGLDWDMWCGPAPLQPFNPRMHPRGWREFLAYANGRAGDWGIHWFDQILWWTEEKYPHTVYSTGGRFVKEDNTTAPDTQSITFEFESFTATWEHRHYAGNRTDNASIGTYFYGTNGIFHMGWRDGWTFYPRNSDDPVIHEDPQLHKPDDQNIPELWTDFLSAIENGTRPISDIETGYHATNMSLLGMLSLKLGRSVRWDGDNGQILHDPEANRLLKRDYRAPWQYPEV